MTPLLSEYEEMKVKLHDTKQLLEDTSEKITHLVKSKLEALLSGRYTQEEKKTVEPRLKELALQKAWLKRTRREQEKKKRAITDSMANLLLLPGARQDSSSKAVILANSPLLPSTVKDTEAQDTEALDTVHQAVHLLTSLHLPGQEATPLSLLPVTLLTAASRAPAYTNRVVDTGWRQQQQSALLPRFADSLAIQSQAAAPPAQGRAVLRATQTTQLVRRRGDGEERRATKAHLMRSYRQDDLPDIQISYSNLLLPMLKLCQVIPELSSRLFSLPLPAVLARARGGLEEATSPAGLAALFPTLLARADLTPRHPLSAALSVALQFPEPLALDSDRMQEVASQCSLGALAALTLERLGEQEEQEVARESQDRQAELVNRLRFKLVRYKDEAAEAEKHALQRPL